MVPYTTLSRLLLLLVVLVPDDFIIAAEPMITLRLQILEPGNLPENDLLELSGLKLIPEQGITLFTPKEDGTVEQLNLLAAIHNGKIKFTGEFRRHLLKPASDTQESPPDSADNSTKWTLTATGLSPATSHSQGSRTNALKFPDTYRIRGYAALPGTTPRLSMENRVSGKQFWLELDETIDGVRLLSIEHSEGQPVATLQKEEQTATLAMEPANPDLVRKLTSKPTPEPKVKHTETTPTKLEHLLEPGTIVKIPGGTNFAGEPITLLLHAVIDEE